MTNYKKKPHCSKCGFSVFNPVCQLHNPPYHGVILGAGAGPGPPGEGAHGKPFPKQRRPDFSLARRLLGWEPRVGVREGLERTIAYFREVLAEKAP